MSEYKPTKGFFDLSEKPKGMHVRDHKKLQNIQRVLIREARKYKDQKIRSDNSVTFNKLRHYFAELQSIILRHWTLKGGK